ncbi:MAG TPA: EipA family protein [Nevskiaceae bacterium]|nr:EipA family protein [Nevskiaceae bacterium]
MLPHRFVDRCLCRHRPRLVLALAAAALAVFPASFAFAADSAPSSIVTPAGSNGVPTPVAALPEQPAASSPPVAPGAAPQAGMPPQGEPVPEHQAPVPAQTYSMHDTVLAANNFFGGTTQGLAKAIQKVFSEFGEPNAYITGNEGGGAFIAGLRYGIGTLQYKGGKPMRIYWQGPSVGFDFGGNASKTFMLVYNLHWTDQLFQRFPGVAGSLYVVAGVGLNYMRADGITIAPIRTGVGLRAGANIGYLSFSRTRTWNPF